MQSKSKSANQGEASPYNIANFNASTETWWKTNEYNSFPQSSVRENASDSSSFEQSVDGQSHSDGGLNEDDQCTIEQSKDDDTKKQGSDGNYHPKESNLQQDGPPLQPRPDNNFTQPAQLGLVSQSIACTSIPCNPYFGGMTGAYDQPMVPHLYDMHQMRMQLPLEVAQEPVYVNAKQYHGILRRRQSRAKATLEKKLTIARKPYLHESRHQHAMRRARSSGGRFAKKSDADTSSKGTGSSSAASSQCNNSSASKPVFPRTEMLEAQNLYSPDPGSYRKQTALQEPVYPSHPGTNREGLASGQQWGNISSNHALAMQ